MGAANLVKSDVVNSDTGDIISSKERTSRWGAAPRSVRDGHRLAEAHVVG